MDRLRRVLEEQYGLDVGSISPAPRGFVAETYLVRTRSGRPYFVKCFPAGRLPRYALDSLPVLPELSRLGMAEINVPLAARSGALYARDEAGVVVVVLSYVDAERASEYDLRRFGELLAGLHRRTELIAVPLVREPFNLPYAVELHASLVAAAQPTADTIAGALQRFLDEYRTEIRQDWNELEQVAARCRGTETRRVITHGDAPGNVLVDRHGGIYIVDWDEILLAPPERDTWFLADEPEFLAGYRGVFGDYTPDRLSYRFYLLNRYFEDLLGYVREILSAGSSEHRAWNLDELHKTCVDWLRPLIRAADQT